MEFRVATRQQDRPGTGGQRLIRQWTPAHRFETHRLQEFGGFRVAEVERGVGGDGHRQGWPRGRRADQGTDRIAEAGIGGHRGQQWPEPFEIQVAPRQLHPDRLSLSQVVKVLGRQESQVAGGELQGGVARQHPQ